MRRLVALLSGLGVLVLWVGMARTAEKAKNDKKSAEHDPEAIFKKIDTDNDGKVSKEEFVKYFQARATESADKIFDEADTDHDGQLTLDEAKKAAEKMREGSGKKDEKGPDVEALFKQIDTDNDGKVSKQELEKFFQAHAAERAGKLFDEADTDHDGSLTLEEFKKAHEKMHEEHHKKDKSNP